MWLSISISVQKMQRIPGPRAFTIHFRDRKKREEEAAYGEQSPSRSHYWPHIQMRVLWLPSRDNCHSAFNIPLVIPWAWNFPCCKSSTLKLATHPLQTHARPWQGPKGMPRSCPACSLHQQKGQVPARTWGTAVIQYLNWCLLTTASLTACVFQSQEIAEYNGRKRPFRCCLWSLGFKIKTSSICQQTQHTKLAGESSPVAISL